MCLSRGFVEADDEVCVECFGVRVVFVVEIEGEDIGRSRDSREALVRVCHLLIVDDLGADRSGGAEVGEDGVDPGGDVLGGGG